LAEEGVISYDAAQEAQGAPLNVSLPERLSQITYASEEIRRELMQRFKDGTVYQEGYSIYTSLDTNIQAFCERSLRSGLELYDKRHGYRGSLLQLKPVEMKTWQESLSTKINA
jgi:penicillin-binding protein 1A